MWRLYKRNSSLNSFNSQKPERKRNLNEESTCGSTGLSEWTPTFTCKIKKQVGSARCQSFSRPLPLLAAGAANIVPARCQQQKWRFCPAKAWLNSCFPPLFSPLPAFFQQGHPFLFAILPFRKLRSNPNSFYLGSLKRKSKGRFAVHLFGRRVTDLLQMILQMFLLKTSKRQSFAHIVTFS